MSRILLALLATAALAPPAQAGILPFFGTNQNQDLPGQPPFRCAPAITVNIEPNRFYAFGSSNLGDFTYRQTHCLASPPPTIFYDGRFEWTFENGDVLRGVYEGEVTGGPPPFDIFGAYTITGGTGRFRHATGAFTNIGTLAFVEGRPTVEGVFEGFIDTPAPAALALFGLGLVGLATRRRAATA
jgi:hypothetical protein